MSDKEIIASVRGKFRKGAQKKANLVEVNTLVLIGLRGFQDGVGDIIHVYNMTEARRLRKDGVVVDACTTGDDGVDIDQDAPEDIAEFDFDEI